MKGLKTALGLTIGLIIFSVVLISGIYYRLVAMTIVLRSILGLILGLILGFLVFSELGIFIILGGKKRSQNDNERSKAEGKE